jgi:ABC-type sugar transport system permease subunit
MNLSPEPIHRWDSKTVVKALLFGAVSEAVAIAPAIFSSWGHAGPESLWGWSGLLLNTPGLFVIWLLRTASGSKETVSVGSAIAYVYLIQTLIFGYIAFVWLRRKKRRR